MQCKMLIRWVAEGAKNGEEVGEGHHEGPLIKQSKLVPHGKAIPGQDLIGSSLAHDV